MVKTLYCVLTIFILAIVFTYHSNSSASSKEFSLLEACRFAKEKAREEWSKDAEIYYVLSVDDREKESKSKGEHGKRRYWNVILAKPGTDDQMLYTIHNQKIVEKLALTEPVNNENIVDLNKIHFDSDKIVDKAKKEYNLLPGKGWAEGYHFVLRKLNSDPTVEVVGRDKKGRFIKIIFNARTGKFVTKITS